MIGIEAPGAHIGHANTAIRSSVETAGALIPAHPHGFICLDDDLVLGSGDLHATHDRRLAAWAVLESEVADVVECACGSLAPESSSGTSSVGRFDDSC
ncbi:hypothetical protein [Nocardia miyunensis]|uniref:hypothetical protein n=1 Tax=Nocardia miyunensis TaxID=282684 RepID=UPI0012F4B77C|nr:hypothetical protein [Nocardia miyunensis]